MDRSVRWHTPAHFIFVASSTVDMSPCRGASLRALSAACVAQRTDTGGRAT
ncbi:MAG TPA: hypothetical protein VIM63_01970 [Rhodoferax sp.]